MLTPMNEKTENVGKLIQSSKRRHTWTFDYASAVHSIVLVLSSMSNKFQIFFDTKEVERGSTPFFHPFEFKFSVSGLSVTIEQQKHNMKLSINDRPFLLGNPIPIEKATPVRMEKSKSVAKLTPQRPDPSTKEKRTTLDLPSLIGANRVTQPPLKMPVRLPPSKQQENIFYTNVFLNNPHPNDFDPGLMNGPNCSQQRMQWNSCDNFEVKPDTFFRVSFNQENELIKNTISKLYLYKR